MAIDPDVQKVIEKIDKRIESLQRTKQALLNEFGGQPAITSNQPATVREAISILRHSPLDEAISEKPIGETTRKESIINFLKNHGPATRGEIIKTLNIPRGTAGFYLTDKKTFVKTQDDKWTVRQDN